MIKKRTIDQMLYLVAWTLFFVVASHYRVLYAAGLDVVVTIHPCGEFP